MRIISKTARVIYNCLWLGLALCFFFSMATPAHAVLTNILVGGDFESPVVTTPGVSDGQFFTDGQFDGTAQWASNGNTSGNPRTNNYELWQEGFLGSPTLGSDGLATGQHLEVRGESTFGQIIVNVDVPADIISGSASVRFDSWFRTSGTTGTIRIRKRLNNSGSWTNITSPTQEPFTGSNAVWTANTYNFNVVANDRIQLLFRNSPRNGDVQEGLHLDDVQVMVDLAAVPEPATLGGILLGAYFLLSWRKRSKIQTTCGTGNL